MIKLFNEEYDWNGKVILIAEDVDVNFVLLQALLRRTNATILRAKDGYETVELCKNNSIDMVLMDIQMPGLDGYQATEQIRTFNMQIPIIAQTANTLAEERKKTLECGFDDYITKPIKIKELFFKISRLFNQ